jgi:DNA-binding winged helix-turn-helix (wHTH) protein
MHSDSPSESLSSTAAMRFQMLDLTIDAGRQTVTRTGAELHVPKLSFDLLLALLRAAPNTVSVADLMERVWPRQVVGVETVAQRIKLLRRALDDNAARPRYLTGARRRGYRIIAPVAILNPASSAPITAADPGRHAPVLQPPAAVAPPPRRRIVVALGLTIALLLVAGLIDLITQGRRRRSRRALLRCGIAVSGHQQRPGRCAARARHLRTRHQPPDERT